MTYKTQPEALRLAAQLEDAEGARLHLLPYAAAELRRLHAEVERLRTDGASAVRWAPGSAYWSDVLRELFGPHARDGINVVEARWRAELERADKLAEALRKLEERVQRDEALLRQALEALEYCRSGEDCHPTLTSEAIDALKERLK